MAFSGSTPFPYLVKPLSNITPFTYRDGQTYLEILEKIRVWLNETLVPDFNAGIDNAIKEFQKGIENAETRVVETEEMHKKLIADTLKSVAESVKDARDYVDRMSEFINNKTGNVQIQRVILTKPFTVALDPLWPTNHPVRFMLTQDATGNREVSLGTNVFGNLTVNKAPGGITEFQLIPQGNGKWRIEQDIDIVQGAFADYTGTLKVAGSGTDNRLAIQSNLNAASKIMADTGYWSFEQRKSHTVKLPAGDYVVTAPDDGSPSLIVPEGVTFDFSDASLFFDYPATAVNSWCGILVRQSANVIVGKMANSKRVPVPDAREMYDGIRLWFSNNSGTLIHGGKDSEIQDFQGAAIRGVGAWIINVSNIRLNRCNYGYIASNFKKSDNGYDFPAAYGADYNRVHTEAHFNNVQFNELKHGGFLGSVQGAKNNVNSVDYAASGLSVDFTQCSFENIAGHAISLCGVYNFGSTDVHYEECGTGGTSGAIIRFDNVRVGVMTNTQVNFSLAGKEVRNHNGELIRPAPSYFAFVGSTQHLKISGLYNYNAARNMGLFVNAAPNNYTIEHVHSDALPMVPGFGYTDSFMSTHLTASYQRPLVLGRTRIWMDSNNRLRVNPTKPTSESDGIPIQNKDYLLGGPFAHALGKTKTVREANFALGEALPKWITHVFNTDIGGVEIGVTEPTMGREGYLHMKTPAVGGLLSRLVSPKFPLSKYSAVMVELEGVVWDVAANGVKDSNTSFTLGIVGSVPNKIGAAIRHSAWNEFPQYMLGNEEEDGGNVNGYNMRRGGIAATKRNIAFILIPGSKTVSLVVDGEIDRSIETRVLDDMVIEGLAQMYIEAKTFDDVAKESRFDGIRLTMWHN